MRMGEGPCPPGPLSFLGITGVVLAPVARLGVIQGAIKRSHTASTSVRRASKASPSRIACGFS